MSHSFRFKLPRLTDPVYTSLPLDMPAKKAVYEICKKYQLNDVEIETSRLVLSPKGNNPGKIMADVEPLLASRYDPAGDLFVICSEPTSLRVLTTDGLVIGFPKMLIIDINTPLNELVPVFQQVFFEGKEEFVYQSIKVDKTTWLNSLKTLKESEFNPETDILGIFPISAFFKNGALLMKGATRGGWLYKQSKGGEESTQTFRIGNLGRQIRPSMSVFKDQSSVGGLSKKMKRYFVLKDNFLAYFDNPTDPNPKCVIPLNFQTVKLKKDVNNCWTLILDRTFKNYFAKTNAPNKLFVLTADENEQNPNLVPQWYEAIKEHCINTGINRMFGASLDSIINKRFKQTIPPVIAKTIGYMDAQGLDVEGIFRLSGSNSEIERYRDAFDQGEDVDLSTCRDPHTVASLLKQFLRELPEPILTFDMYDKYIAAVRDLPAEQRLPVLIELTSNLPEQYFTILKYLLSFLQRVNLMASVNKMTLANLATCFGQNLLRPRDTSNPATIVEDSIYINQATQMLIEHESKLYYKNPQVNERVEQTQKERQNTEKSKVRQSLVLLRDELIARQSLIKSETAAGSLKTKIDADAVHEPSPFEPLNERNSFSTTDQKELPQVPVDSRKTLSAKPLPEPPANNPMLRRSISFDSLAKSSALPPIMQPKQTLTKNPESNQHLQLSPRAAEPKKPLLHVNSYSPNSKRMSQMIPAQKLDFENSTFNASNNINSAYNNNNSNTSHNNNNNDEAGPVSMPLPNINNINGNNYNVIPPSRPVPPPRNSVMFAAPPKFPGNSQVPPPSPQQNQPGPGNMSPTAPPKSQAKFRYSTMLPQSAVALPGMPDRRPTTIDHNSGAAPNKGNSVNGPGAQSMPNYGNNTGTAPAPPTSPKPRASMVINPNQLHGANTAANHTPVTPTVAPAANSSTGFVMPKPVNLAAVTGSSGNTPTNQGEAPTSPRQGQNNYSAGGTAASPVQNRPPSMSVLSTKPTWLTHVLKEGLLTKKGEVRHNWKVRWFILTPASLYYFKSRQETATPLGIVPLQDAEVMAYDGKRFSFFVKTPIRTYFVQTKSDFEQQDWMNSIIMTINKLKGADPQKLEQMQRETQLVTKQVEINKANRRSAMISSEQMADLNLQQ